MAPRVFDAIVVGTGAGGSTAMKILCEAGLQVCALNSGPRIDPAKDYRGHRQVYDLKFRGYGNPLRLQRKAHQEPYSVEESEYSEASDLFEHDVAYSNAPGTDWYWKRCKATGGKANFWGRSSARFGDIDFKAADLDGVGENWPVDYAEMAPWFSKAERYMGVASTVQNRPSNPDGEYLPPMPWRCIDYIIQKGAEKIGLPYLPDRCAQLTVAHNGHPACHYCGNCSRGCDVGSFFSPTWFTIPDAEATKHLTLLTNALVRSVLVDQDGMATGVAYVDRATRREVEVYAKVVVLAASCVETAHIMLNSTSRHWPTGIANSSGQLGRNLCEHLYGISRIWIPAPAPRAACDAGQHRRLHGGLDAALAESDEPSRGKIHPGLFGLHGRGLWRVPRLLLADRGLRLDLQARYQAVLPDANRLTHSGADASQSHQLRRHRSGQEGHLRHPAAAFSLPMGSERAVDVGALQAGDGRPLQSDGWRVLGHGRRTESSGHQPARNGSLPLRT